jgi:hypothetical protein
MWTLHYERGMPVEEAAKLFITSASTGYRVIGEARKPGVVRTTIDAASYFGLEENPTVRDELRDVLPSLKFVTAINLPKELAFPEQYD